MMPAPASATQRVAKATSRGADSQRCPHARGPNTDAGFWASNRRQALFLSFSCTRMFACTWIVRQGSRSSPDAMLRRGSYLLRPSLASLAHRTDASAWGRAGVNCALRALASQRDPRSAWGPSGGSTGGSRGDGDFGLNGGAPGSAWGAQGPTQGQAQYHAEPIPGARRGIDNHPRSLNAAFVPRPQCPSYPLARAILHPFTSVVLTAAPAGLDWLHQPPTLATRIDEVVQHPSLVLARRIEWGDVLVGFEQRNTYAVQELSGQTRALVRCRSPVAAASV